jgi:hypothetical protein
VSETVLIPRRFNGPPDSGHGGYSCGLVGVLAGNPAEVSLRVPPPLERELTIERSDGSVVARDGETVVAEGRSTELDLEPPEAIGIEDAEAANARGLEFMQEVGHPFPTCFVCGPEREPGDGFRVFVSRLPGREDLYGASWTPDPELAGANGMVLPEIVWAALDCPSSGPGVNWGKGPPCVLAWMAAALDAPVRAGEPHALLAWPVEIDGRKRHTGVALYDADGRVLARARALWIELKE